MSLSRIAAMECQDISGCSFLKASGMFLTASPITSRLRMTAARVLLSEPKASRDMPRMNDWMASAASTTSARSWTMPLPSRIQSALQYVHLHERLQCAWRHEVHLGAEALGQV